MKKYQLISTDPLQRLTSFPDVSKGFPGLLRLQDDVAPPELPEGFKYVILQPQPPHNSDTHRLNRVLTTETDGWELLPLTAEELEDRRRSTIPTIKAWQAKAALRMAGHYDNAVAAIAAISDPTEKVVIESAWEGNADFNRFSPAVIGLGSAIGLSDADLDALFMTASQIST